MAASYERLDYGSPDGSQWGTVSSDRISFFGNTPVAQQGITSNASTISASTDILGMVTTIASTLIAYGLLRRL